MKENYAFLSRDKPPPALISLCGFHYAPRPFMIKSASLNTTDFVRIANGFKDARENVCESAGFVFFWRR